MLASLARYNARAVQERKAEEEAEVMRLVTEDLDSDSEESDTWEQELFTGQTVPPSQVPCETEDAELTVIDNFPAGCTRFPHTSLDQRAEVQLTVVKPLMSKSARRKFKTLHAKKKAIVDNQDPLHSLKEIKRGKNLRRRREQEEEEAIDEMLRVIPSCVIEANQFVESVARQNSANEERRKDMHEFFEV
ncbi:hypothetical protein HYDPIDRAFT_25676 [Hydnomerulius pinastri MD-312]|nr:hypothetical protein HYDPIDRAFT_25676 [Hydnomerulius pinastri MD-312]